MKLPLLSIVIANYNYGRFLEDAIRSVISQDMGDKIELIICDAASTDNSVDIIKKYANGLPPNVPFADWNNSQRQTPNSQLITWWCSESDEGQSAAFNKGFSHAKGEYLTWLNADDIYLGHSLQKVINKLRRTNADWATANFVRFDYKTGKIIEAKWGPHLLPRWMQGNGWPIAVYGPTSFWRRSVYAALGPIREDFSYAMDTEYWTRMSIAKIKYVRVNVACWGFGMHFASKTAEFSGHVCSDIVKTRQRQEDLLRRTLNNYRENRCKSLAWKLWRIADGSFLVQLLRSVFVVGHKLNINRG